MALADSLSLDGDIDALKTALNTTMITLTASATQLALISLERSEAVLNAAFNSEPVVGYYAYFTDVRKFAEISRQAMQSADVVVGCLCAMNENLDDEVNASYSDYLEGIVNNSPINALLSEAERKMALACEALPANILNASRFDGSVFLGSRE
jgi:hypothetical protein